MREISFIDKITNEKRILGYLDPNMVRGIMQHGERACTVFIQANQGAMMALQINAPMEEMKGAFERAKSGTVLQVPEPSKN